MARHLHVVATRDARIYHAEARITPVLLHPNGSGAEAVSMGKRGRLSAARVLLYRDAWAEVKASKRELFVVTVGLLSVTAVLNLPLFPVYERGLSTGVLLTFLAFGIIWRVWVSSGLSDRLHGVWAEDATAEHLAKARTVWGYVPSYKVNGYDVDHVAVTPAGVYGIESKFHRRKITSDLVAYDAQQAATRARTMKHDVSRRSVPTDLFGAVLVIWGPRANKLERHTINTGLGPVLILPGGLLDSWLAELAVGPIGEDFAQELLQVLDATARARDAAGMKAGRAMRRFARAK